MFIWAVMSKSEAVRLECGCSVYMRFSGSRCGKVQNVSFHFSFYLINHFP